MTDKCPRCGAETEENGVFDTRFRCINDDCWVDDFTAEQAESDAYEIPRKPFGENDTDLREHGYIAVYRANAHGGMRREGVGFCYGTGPATTRRGTAAKGLASNIEKGTDYDWLDDVPDPEALAEDLRELGDIVIDNLRD